MVLITSCLSVNRLKLTLTANEQNPHRLWAKWGFSSTTTRACGPGADAALAVVLACRRGGRGALLTAPEFQRRLGRLWRAEPFTHRVATLVETQLIIPCLGGSPQTQWLQGGQLTLVMPAALAQFDAVWNLPTGPG